MEYYGNTLCISAREIVERGIMSQACYDKNVQRGNMTVARSGKGQGRYALIAVDSLPTKYREKVEAQFPDGPEVRLEGWVTSHYQVDQGAMAFFHDRRKTGLDLTPEKIQEYVVNASVMNTCIALYDRASAYRKLMGETYDWKMMARVVEVLKEKYHHTLPASMLRFKQKVNQYRKGGYVALISGKFGNQNTRKVDMKLERLVLGLWCLPNKPYGSQVRDLYDSFICGELDAYDVKTGELFNPDDFTDKNGEPVSLSDSTIRNILNKPTNRLIWDKSQLSWTSFMHEAMPHMHRHAGEFSLSQITMDDVDLTRKLKDTKLRVKAYYAYDSVSQCVIGASYSRNKDPQLVRECFRDMFRLIAKHGWGIPAGIEVENHLMTEYKYTLLQEGTVFSHVRFCAPLNSQEKYAEAMNGAKKRSVIHRNHTGIGRFYGKWQWRAESKKVSDASNDTYEDKEYYSFDELVADDRRDNYEWNHTLHPNQKKYKGMTRWDVLMDNINPLLRPFDPVTLARYIGEKVETSIRRNSTVRVAYEDWWLSSPEVLERLAPNNYKVTAYYLPDEDGKPQEVFIFQGDRYIDQVERVQTYNRVMAEQTEEDKRNFYHQQKKVREFMAYTDEHMVPSLGTMKGVKEVKELKKLRQQPPETQADDTNYKNKIDYEAERKKEVEALTAEPPGAQAQATWQQGLGVSAPDVSAELDEVQGADGRPGEISLEERSQARVADAPRPRPSTGETEPNDVQGVRQTTEVLPGYDQGTDTESTRNDGLAEVGTPPSRDDEIDALLAEAEAMAENPEAVKRRGVEMI